jgi:hypothetical protein
MLEAEAAAEQLVEQVAQAAEVKGLVEALIMELLELIILAAEAAEVKVILELQTDSLVVEEEVA